EFLQGNWQLECTPWGNPTYNIFGWQKPCYLIDEGYVQSFRELIETTKWSNYGRASGNASCQNCMMHCGYEPTAVNESLGSMRGMWGAARTMLFGSMKRRAGALVSANQSASESAEPVEHLPALPVISSPKVACDAGCGGGQDLVTSIAMVSRPAVEGRA